MNGKISLESNNPAVLTTQTTISYLQLGQLTVSAADLFTSKGIKREDYTGVLLNNSVEFIASVFALWQSGATPVLLNTKLTTAEIDELLRKANVKNLITNNKYSGKVPDGYNIILTEEIKKELSGKGTVVSIDNIVIFTSGSSGSPKGVMLNSDALINSIKTGNTVLKQTKDDRWLASLPFYHIGGLMIFMRAFSLGASIILPETLKLEEIKSAFELFKPTLASLVPTQLHRFLEEGAHPNPELRNILIGGGAIEQQLISEALQKGWPVSTVYGSTETASFVAYTSPGELKINPGSSGRPVSPNQIEIIDSGVIEGDPSGEIVIQSASLFEKYINDDTETSHKLVNGKYYTGDYGIIDQDGFLYVLSRRTDMIISGGENIDPAEVEKKIKLFPGIKDVCVFGRKSDEWGEVVNAAISADKDFSDEKLTEFLKKELASYKIPKEYFIMDEIPRTALGKIRREKIKQTFNQS